MVKEVAFLFHMYQPSWQYPEVLKKVCDECYGWLTDWIKNNNLKITLNLNYSLTELLQQNQHNKIIENIGLAAEKKVIEFTDSAAYHAFLPLLPESEIKRQIALNNEKNSDVFGNMYTPRGFFPPEMAYSNKLSKILKEIGYDWTITENTIYKHNMRRNIPNNSIPTINGMKTLFRSEWSNKFAMEYPNQCNTNAEFFINQLDMNMENNSYIILAFDMETIGHHQPYNEKTMDWLKRTMDEKNIISKTISEIVNDLPVGEELVKNGFEEFSGSWSTTQRNLLNQNYFPLWNHPNNEIHKLQWKLTHAVIEYVESNKRSSKYELARNFLDRGLNSCQYWWADMERWNYKYIMDGMKNLYLAAEKIGYDEKVENIYNQLLTKMNH